MYFMLIIVIFAQEFKVFIGKDSKHQDVPYD